MKYFTFEKPLIIVHKHSNKPFIIRTLSMPDYDSIYSSVVEFKLLDSRDNYADYIQLNHLFEYFILEPHVYEEILYGYDELLRKHQDLLQKEGTK